MTDAQPRRGAAERKGVPTTYSRDGKWLWTGDAWVAIPSEPPSEPPPVADPVRRRAYGLVGLIVAAATLATVAVTVVQHM